MRYFIDTEFHEYEKKGNWTIDLISIGIVREDGKYLYLVNRDFDIAAAWKNKWLKENVLATLYSDYPLSSFSAFKKYISEQASKKEEIKILIEDFFADDEQPEIWGYYCDYDCVVFSWIWGRMIDKPSKFPYNFNDVQQVIDMFNLDKKEIKKSISNINSHNALHDALEVKQMWEYINKL